MTKRITLNLRAIVAPNSASNSDVDYDLSMNSIETVWAMVDTVSGESIFDSSNQERDVTHRFYIRFRTDVTQETWIEYNNEFFDILTVENFDENDTFLLLRATTRGSTTKPVNRA